MAKKKYLEESERKLIESVNNAYIPTDWDEFEKCYHEMERYGDGKPRKVDKEKMEYIEDGLVSRGIGGNQLSSLLSTIVEESGGNPFSVDDSGKFRGLIQFSKKRYPEKDFDRDKKAGWKKAVDNQLDAIVDHLNEYGGDYGFLDGGDGSGYMTGEEAKDAFWGRDSDIENVTRALTYGFVRPGDRPGTTENRTRVARLINEIIQPPVEAPDVLEFDYDGKHYRAETPEEVTPEMRRALMLSKLVGEKNRVELQDPLYTTFNEAYGRARGKGARVFMWNGKKYSTKEDGGEVKDMEKFGKILESLYNEDVERVRNGEQAQYFGALNDKPLENVYPEFDLISKPANMVSKGADMINRPLGVISGDIKEDVYGGLEKMAKYTGKVDDYVRRLYYKGTKSVFDKLPEIVKPLARQVFSKYYNWRRLTVPETIRLSREIFGGEDEPESFDAAFKAARDQGLDKFKWNGNEYTTDIKEEGGDTNAAEFSLPEVNVYPNNRFGDIARSQGLKTAQQWMEVRNATAKGINDFVNDPRTQFVLGMLPLPTGIEGAGEISKLIKKAKDFREISRDLRITPWMEQQLAEDAVERANWRVLENEGALGQGRLITQQDRPSVDLVLKPRSRRNNGKYAGGRRFINNKLWWSHRRPFYWGATRDGSSKILYSIDGNNADIVRARDLDPEYPNDWVYLTDEVVLTDPKLDTKFFVPTEGGYFVPSNHYKFTQWKDDMVDMMNSVKPEEWAEFREGGDTSKKIKEDEILSLVLSSNANFVNRLKQENRSTIPDWRVKGNIATHKMSAEIGEDGRVYVYPNVQEIDGKLKDFTNPKYGYPDEGRWDALKSAIEHNDYVVFPDIESAVWFTENYKNKGWFPEFSDGGLSRLAPRDNTSVGRPGSAEVSPVTPSDAARNNPVISTIASFTPIVGEMLDIQDLYTSLKNNDKTGILLALTGLVPIIGGVAGNVIKRNNPFWKERIFSPEEIKRDEELVSKFPNYAHPNSPMGAAVLNHEERLVNNAFRKFQNIPASRIGIDPETGNVVYDFNGLDFRFVDISNADELKKISDYTGLTSEELLEYIGNNPFTSFGDHILINRKYIDEAAEKGETDFIFRDGIPHNSPQEEVVRSHEIDHLVGHGVQRESAENSGFSFDWMDDYPELGKEYSGYFRFNNNTEVAARGSQLKDYFGLTNSEQKITPEMLEYAYRHYLDDYGINNDMDLFFKSITDFKKASDWINKYSTAGLGAYWLFDRAESVKDENLQNGGLIKFSKKIDGSSIFERNMVSPWRKITRDMVPTASPSWTNKRKRRFGRKDGGDVSNITPRDNTSVGRPGPADVQPVKPSAAARENPVVPFVASLLPEIEDVIDAHDFIQAAKDKNMVGMALAAAGFIPLVGDAFQEASRFARGRRNSHVRYDAPPRRNDIKESDEELLRKMPDYARPGYPAMEALNVHRRRLSDGAYEQRTGQGGAEARQELEGFAETFPGIYDRIFDLDYINEDDMDAARRVIEIIDKQPKGSAGTMSDEGVVKRLNDIKQRLVRSSPAFAEGIKGNAGIISLDNWSDFFMDEAYRSGISHELDHAVYLNTPEETIKELSGKVDGWFDSSKIEDKGVRDYISRPMELLARGTQIKDFYGLTDNAEKVTPEMLKFAARHYVDNVMDNQMTEFFNGIKDWDKAAEWISKYSTATLPAITVSKLLQDGKEKDEYPVNRRHGGPISEDGSVGGDYILDDGGRSLYRRSEYIKGRLLSKYNLLPEESDGIISDLIGKSSLDEKFYDPKHKSYGIGQWSGKDLKEFVLTYKDGGLADQIDFLAKKYWDGFGKDGKGDIEPGVFDEHRWVVKRIGNEEFYTNSPLLKTLPSMSREDVALSLLPPELWPGVLKRKEDVTGKSARRHFIRGGEVSELQDYIYDRLTKEHGIAPIQAIGIVANLTQESALDYDALGDNGRSYGIQQWQGDRRRNLFEFAKKRGRDKPALDDQVDFLVEEYKGDGFLFPTRGENMYKTGKTDKDMFDYFQYSKLDFDNAANIYDSTRAWAQGFGRGNKNFLNMDRRFHIAKTLSSRYNIDAGGQSFYTDMGYKDEWGSPVPEVAVSAEKKAAQDDWMEKYGNKMLASILAGDGEGGDTHVTNNYYVNEEGLSEDEKRNAAEVQKLQRKQQAEELLASIIDGIKLDIKGVTEVRKR